MTGREVVNELGNWIVCLGVGLTLLLIVGLVLVLITYSAMWFGVDWTVAALFVFIIAAIVRLVI